MKGLPVLIVHGDHDLVASFDASRTMFQHAKEAGLEVEFLPVKDGDHYLSWVQVAPQIFDFFNRHRQRQTSPR